MHPRNTAVLVGLVLWTAANVVWSIGLSTHGRAEPASPAPAGIHAHASSAADESTAPGTPVPPRRTLTLPNEAREAVLAEMRTMLQAIQGVLVAGARGDSAAVRIAARPAGMAMAADPELEALLPADWMTLALDTHRAFDSLPGGGPEPAAILAGLGRITGRCNACHAMYRLEIR